jgi:Zn-dependent protease with chaperone function
MKTFLFAVLLIAFNASAQTGQDGVAVKKSSLLLLPASTVERSAAQQYGQLMRTADQRRLLNNDPQQVERLRRIARELIPHAPRFNKNAAQWRWEVNLITSKTVNAFCMPGGKIAFFTGILDSLQLTDDEVATIMGHEMGHALLEHGRARMSEQLLKNIGISAAAILLNLGQVSTEVLAQAANLAVSLPYARKQESDADLVGLELSARAGHDPRAAITVWQKMSRYAQSAKSGGQPPQFLSTHPSNENRIREIEANLPKVLPLYKKAP